MAETRSFRVPVPGDFHLEAVIASHGWYQLAPFACDRDRGSLAVTLRGASARPLALSLTQSPKGVVRASLERKAGPRVRSKILERVRYMLALDQDLGAFHEHCRSHDDHAWIAQRRLGRFLRGEDVFEDMVKTLLTTNCTWTQTVNMVERLVRILGTDACVFPTPAQIRDAGLRTLTEEIRVGYRARAMLELAELACREDLDQLPRLAEEDCARRLKSLRGFGTYAASSLLLIWGAPDHQIIDSWALARAKEVHGRGKAVTEKRLRRLYAKHAPYRGLVAWFALHRPGYERVSIPDFLAYESP